MSENHDTNLEQRIKKLRAELDGSTQQSAELHQDSLRKKSEPDSSSNDQLSSEIGDQNRSNADLGRAYELLATPLVCGGIGLAVDHYADTSPWGFIIGAVLGVLAAFWTIYKASQNIATPLDLKRLQKRKKTDKR